MDFWVPCGDKCGLCCTASENSDIKVGVFHSQLFDDGSTDVASSSEAVIKYIYQTEVLKSFTPMNSLT